MPTTNKRINLTIPEQIYDRLQNYKQKNGITSDASACLQLVIRQLDSIENGERMLQMVSRFTEEELQQLTSLSVPFVKQLADMQTNGDSK